MCASDGDLVLDSTPARDVKMADPLVRRWDPEAWRPATGLYSLCRTLTGCGDFRRALASYCRSAVTTFSHALTGGARRRSMRWVDGSQPPLISAEARMAALADEDDAGSCVDDVIWRFRASWLAVS